MRNGYFSDLYKKMRIYQRSHKIPKGYRRVRLGQLIPINTECFIDYPDNLQIWTFETMNHRLGINSYPVYIKKYPFL